MNCKKYRTWMSDAATEGLSARQQSEFQAHVRDCSYCREELARAQALLETIDRGVMAQVSVEPSLEFMVRLRQKLPAEGAPGTAIWTWRVPAAACTAVIIIAMAMWMMWPGSVKPGPVASTNPATKSLVAANHSTPNVPGNGTATIRGIRTPAVSSVRQVKTRKLRRFERETETPDVIIQRGEEKALLQFAAALQSGKIDGAKLLSEQRQADQPIEIKPILIPLLDNTAQAQDKSNASDDQGERRDFVSGESSRGLLR